MTNKKSRDLNSIAREPVALELSRKLYSLAPSFRARLTRGLNTNSPTFTRWQFEHN